jgi:hypothetical protein
MTEHDKSDERADRADTARHSIFPYFDVNVPMPAGTAVPGSYIKPPQQPASNTPAPKPAQTAG